MITTKLKETVYLSKEETLTEFNAMFSAIVNAGLTCFTQHDARAKHFILNIPASDFGQIKKMFPKTFKDKTAPYGKTVYFKYE